MRGRLHKGCIKIPGIGIHLDDGIYVRRLRNSAIRTEAAGDIEGRTTCGECRNVDTSITRLEKRRDEPASLGIERRKAGSTLAAVVGVILAETSPPTKEFAPTILSPWIR